MYYPKIKFYAFDIGIRHENKREYLDYDKSIKIFQKCNIFYAKPLFIGSLRDCMKFNIRFKTNIPKWD